MHQTIRIRVETYKKLKLLCALMGKTLVVLLDEFADTKLAEVQSEQRKPLPVRSGAKKEVAQKKKI